VVGVEPLERVMISSAERQSPLPLQCGWELTQTKGELPFEGGCLTESGEGSEGSLPLQHMGSGVRPFDGIRIVHWFDGRGGSGLGDLRVCQSLSDG